MNVEFLLMVSYRKTDDGDSELYGTATLTINIEILFFSISVHVTLEKRIAGSTKRDVNQSEVAASADVTVLGSAGTWPLSLVSLQTPPNTANVGPARARALDRTYFKRSDFHLDPKSTDEKLEGRFDWDDGRPTLSACQWVEDYWSQFDLTPH